ncbi:MAG: nuclear transport factor 2 family protein [Planctomycetota bacterium]
MLVLVGCAAMPDPDHASGASARHDDEQELRAALAQWIDGWSPGTDTWTGEQLRPLYAAGPRAIRVFDNVEGDVVDLRSFAAYQAEWTAMMAPMRDWEIALVEPAEVRVAGDMAYATFIFEGGEDPSHGDAVRIRQYGTLVWERQGSDWVITHEHLTAGTVR